MPRIRTVKPDFFKHYDLFKAEQESKLPLRLGFQGLWICADKDGRFRWQPHQLKLDILPYDGLDFNDILEALLRNHFIIKYEANGKHYGNIPSFPEHQRITGTEAKSESKIPAPPSLSIEKEDENEIESPEKHFGSTEETSRTTGMDIGNGYIGNGLMGMDNGNGDSQSDSLIFDAEKEILGNRIRFEQIMVAARKEEPAARDALHMYHLWLQDKEKYPKSKKSCFPGFEKWLLNENKFDNGTHKSSHGKNNGVKPVTKTLAPGNRGNL